MSKIKYVFPSLLVIMSIVFLSACGVQKNNSKTEKNKATSTASTKATKHANGKYGKYSDKDLTVAAAEDADAKIVLKDQATKVTGTGVKVKGNIITITKAGTYEFRGILKDGQIVVAADKNNDDVNIILNGVKITNNQSSPFYVKSADKVIVTLAEGSTNQFTDGKKYVYENNVNEPDATIFSKADLTFNGAGKLKVVGNYKDGIRSKDDLVFIDGAYEVKAANNGVKGNDSVSILAGNYTIDAKNDGIQASNTKDKKLGWVGIDDGHITINANHDGIQAETNLSIAKGTVRVTTGGGAKNAAKTDEQGDKKMGPPEMGAEPPKMDKEKGKTKEETTNETESSKNSIKGLKAGTNLQIDGGKFMLDTADDSLHAKSNVTIKNGSFTIASGDDGIHAGVTTIIKNGTIKITESYEGIEGTNVVIEDGKILVNSSDDGINASSSTNDSAKISIKGGMISVNADGDGVDSNGDIVMTGGTLLVDGPEDNGNGALDYDKTFKQSGGLLIAVGSSGMAMATSEDSKQAALSLYFDDIQKAKKLISISDDGKVIATYRPEKSYQHVVISSPDLKKGNTYHISIGGKSTGKLQNGLYTDGKYSGEELLKVKLTDTITSITQNGETATKRQVGGPGGGSPPPEGKE